MKKSRLPGKQIPGLDPEGPIVDIARIVLETRLKAVEMLLPLAAERAEEDEEYIHQLRVATRRADAALRTFHPFIGKKTCRQVRRCLRRIRRASLRRP